MPSSDTAPRTRHRLPPVLLISITVGSLAVALLVATLVVRLGHDSTGDDVVSVDQFVSGDARTAVEGSAAVGQPAPPTTFVDFDGKGHDLSSLAGKPVVINFWASTSAPCLKEMPAFERAHQSLGDEVTVLGIDVSEAVDPGRKMIDTTGVTYQQGRDPQGEMIRAYGGVTLPHTVVIDGDGTVAALRNKALDDDDIRAALEPVLGR